MQQALGFMISVGALLACGALAQEEALFANRQFAFYPDRMEAFDVYKGVYRSAQGMTFTKDGDPDFKWEEFRPDSLYLQTPYPILDAAFSLAVDEALKSIAPGRYYYWTKGGGMREYTRDTAQHVQWGDSVIIDREAAKRTILRRCDFGRERIREDCVTTADNIHFIPAAWEFFKITGDKDFLVKAWNCMWNEMTEKEAQRRKPDGLWTGSPWSDSKWGFCSPDHFEQRNTHVKSLYANTMVAGAWRSLAHIAEVLEKTEEKKIAESKYAESKNAINKVLYRPEIGTYCYYKYDPDQSYCDYREDISSGLIYLFGVADRKRTMEYHAKFTATPYGYRNLDPVTPRGESDYHGGNVWENQEGYHGWMLAKLDRPDDLENFIFWHARAGLVVKEWREGTRNPSTGELHKSYRHLVWGSMGYTSYWTRGVFGINYDLDGIRFDPCVPGSFGDAFYAVLNNFTYRDSSMRIILRGKGCTVDRVLLNGKEVTVVPPELTGRHTVQVLMKNHDNTVIPEPYASRGA